MKLFIYWLVFGVCSLCALEPLKVSVICPTFERADKHASLYQAFSWQTYENKELLVFDDSHEPSPFFSQLKDERVHYYYHSNRSSIGFKRNFLNEKASGEIIAHFDDDDYYAPEYLSDMVGHLGSADLIKLSRWLAWRESDGSCWEWTTDCLGGFHFLIEGSNCASFAISGYHLFHDMQEAQRWTDANAWGYGFSYVYKKSLWNDCKFDDISSAEDYLFLSKAKTLGKQLMHIPDYRHLVIHLMHSKGTSRIFPQRRYPENLIDKKAEPWLPNCLKSKLKDKAKICELFHPFVQKDAILERWLADRIFEDYEPHCLQNGHTFCVESESRDLIKGFIKKGYAWENHILEQFKKFVKPGSTVIDVGGHIGIHTLSLSHLVGEQGVVHVFEPQCKMFAELVLNMYLNNRSNIVFYRQALGEAERIATMNKISDLNEGNTSIGTGGDEVVMAKLDDFHLNDISLMKIDAEGYEENIIDGALATIDRCKPVLIIEIWSDENLQNKIRKIEKLGYRAVRIANVHDYLFLPE